MAVQTTNAPATLAPLFARFDAWRERLQKRRAYYKTLRELEALTDRELSDFGMSRSDLRHAAAKAVYG